MFKYVFLLFLAIICSTGNAAEAVARSKANCHKLNGDTKNTRQYAAQNIGVPFSEMQLLGAVAGNTFCVVQYQTPKGPYNCFFEQLLTDDGGKTTYAAGIATSCEKAD